MAERNFGFAELASLRGGAFRAEVDYEIDQILRDIESRPRDKRARKLLIEVEVKPLTELDASDRLCLWGCEVDTKLSSKVPKLQPGPIVAKVVQEADGGSRLVWNEESPRNPRQGALPFAASEAAANAAEHAAENDDEHDEVDD